MITIRGIPLMDTEEDLGLFERPSRKKVLLTSLVMFSGLILGAFLSNNDDNNNYKNKDIEKINYPEAPRETIERYERLYLA
ncbi:hypothetical protein HYT56_04380 [Candidatus Woesearchaeota archaeon]|nr:hypothetical protein [Candidatus Woesearchaeota archaeon]